MKTLSTLFLILTICAISATLYLKAQYIVSAILTIFWVISITAWIGANGYYERKKAMATK